MFISFLCAVEYDDGDTEWLRLSKEKWKVLSAEKPKTGRNQVLVSDDDEDLAAAEEDEEGPQSGSDWEADEGQGSDMEEDGEASDESDFGEDSDDGAPHLPRVNASKRKAPSAALAHTPAPKRKTPATAQAPTPATASRPTPIGCSSQHLRGESEQLLPRTPDDILALLI